jgi:predicted O-linked N-acetylglucosamine transferase (SPINDLY family)
MKKNQNKYSPDLSRLYERGCALFEEKRFEEAAEVLGELVSKGPVQVGPYAVYAITLSLLGRHRESIKFFDKAIEKEPANEGLYVRKIYAIFGAGDTRAAIKEAESVLEVFPDSHTILIALATVCSKSGPEFHMRGAQALEKIFETEPDNVTALNCMGAMFSAAGKYREAINYFIRVLRLEPDHIIALLNIAGCFDKLAEPEMALKFYDSLLKISPENGLALCAKATILSNLGLSAENVGLLEKGIGYLAEEGDTSNYVVYASNYVFYVHYVPGVERQKIYNAIQEWYSQTCSNVIEKPRTDFANDPAPGKKLRIGMLSNSFKRHPVTWMTLAALENLDKSKFEVFIYSDILAKKRDEVTASYYGLCDRGHEINGLSNQEMIERMRKDELDILLELTGHSEGGRRLGIAAARVAPVQVKWVGGLFDTTGLPQMDWIIGDKIEIPDGDEKWYTERVYHMPDDYVVYDPPPYVSEVKPLPALECGYVTFGNLNNLCKTNTYTIALWSKILKAVPKSRLLMKVQKMETAFAKQHIEEEFAKHGVGIERLILEGGEIHKPFMEAYNRVDIALDPYPYTGGLSTCEALWMGVPVVTLPGETFAGRHGATHLYNAGLPDWIAKNEDEYVSLAVKWAQDLEGLAKLRSGLREQVKKSPLCDGPRFAKNFEKALRFMWNDWCDEKLDHDKGGKADYGPKAIKALKPKKKQKKK